MAEAELARESVGSPEGLRRERREMVHVLGSPLSEERLEHRVGEDLAVEELLEAMDRLLSAGVLEEGRAGTLRVRRHRPQAQQSGPRPSNTSWDSSTTVGCGTLA